MSHDVDETTGVAALAYNERNGTPWHKLGTPIDGRFTVDELKAKEPSLFFTIEGRPLVSFVPSFTGATMPDPARPVWPVPGYKAIMRTDTDKVLGVVSNDYREYQPEELFRFGEALVGEGVYGDVAGSLLDGRLVFITFAFDDAEAKRLFDFDPSPYFRHLVASAGNDGRHALRAKNTRTRVLCHNTYNAHLGGTGREVVIRHTANMEAHVEDAKRALGMAAKQDEAFQAAMHDLSKRDVNWADVMAYVEALFPAPQDGQPHVRIEAAREAVRDLYATSPNLEAIDKTAYRLFQATGEYVDHKRSYNSGLGSKDDARALAVLDGAAGDIKERALKLLVTAK